MMDLNQPGPVIQSVGDSFSLLYHALMYARMGWSVFPCKIDKSPHTTHGFKDASRDPEQIRAWWTRWPNASIGMPTGAVNGVWVLDVDVPNTLKPNKPDGRKSLAELEAKHEKLPYTLMQRTGGGGIQYFWEWTGIEIKNSDSAIAPGIDVRGNGGYVILPPSSHPTGGRYTWI